MDFLPGQFFDIRLEVHAPVNGSQAVANPTPNPNFSLTITPPTGAAMPAAAFFNTTEPKVENWNFTWFEDLFAQDAKTPSVVRVAAKAYRKVALYHPGQYTATLNYNNGSATVAHWLVRDIPATRKAKNVVLFIGDGMTTNMITGGLTTAARCVVVPRDRRQMLTTSV